MIKNSQKKITIQVNSMRISLKKIQQYYFLKTYQMDSLFQIHLAIGFVGLEKILMKVIIRNGM